MKRLERLNMTCEEFEELSGAFALDAVTPAEHEEAEEAEAHLTICARCASFTGNAGRGLSLAAFSPTNFPTAVTTRARPLCHTRREQEHGWSAQSSQRQRCAVVAERCWVNSRSRGDPRGIDSRK